MQPLSFHKIYKRSKLPACAADRLQEWLGAGDFHGASSEVTSSSLLPFSRAECIINQPKWDRGPQRRHTTKQIGLPKSKLGAFAVNSFQVSGHALLAESVTLILSCEDHHHVLPWSTYNASISDKLCFLVQTSTTS